MANKRIQDLPAASSLVGTELIELSQSNVSVRSTVDDIKAKTLAGYTGSTNITTLGTVSVGTWNGAFKPRVSTDITIGTLSMAPMTYDVKILTGLNQALTTEIKTTPIPFSSQEVWLIITDNGTPRALNWDPGTVRFVGVSDPGTTIINQTVYFKFVYNLKDDIWDCVLCTDSSGGAVDSVNGQTGTVVLTASDVGAASLTGAETLTNKRITKRTGTVTSSANPTINTDSVDFFSITAQSTTITSMTSGLSGTPTENQLLWIAITDNGTARGITWGPSFEGVLLPNTTVISTRLDVGLTWNSVTSKWRCVACN